VTTAPLAGVDVLVTRPAAQADALVEAIEAAGGHAHRFPVIDIVPETAGSVAAWIAELQPADILIFVSANAARLGLAAVRGSASSVAAIGPATAEASRDAGRSVDIQPAGGYNSEHLLATDALKDVDGKTVTIVRGQSGRELLAETLRSRGALVQYLSVYSRQRHDFTAKELAAIERVWQDEGIDAVIVMSVASLDALLDSLPQSCLDALPQTRLVGVSERVIQTALGRLPGVHGVLAPGPRADDLLGALIASLHTDSDP